MTESPNTELWCCCCCSSLTWEFMVQFRHKFDCWESLALRFKSSFSVTRSFGHWVGKFLTTSLVAAFWLISCKQTCQGWELEVALLIYLSISRTNRSERSADRLNLWVYVALGSKNLDLMQQLGAYTFEQRSYIIWYGKCSLELVLIHLDNPHIHILDATHGQRHLIFKCLI